MRPFRVPSRQVPWLIHKQEIRSEVQNSAMNRPEAKWSWPLYFQAMDVDLRLNLAGEPLVRTGQGDGTVFQQARGTGLLLAQEASNSFSIYDIGSQLPLAGGTRADGFLDVQDASRGVMVATRWFWQWPNGLLIDGRNRLSIQLFPDWSSQWWDPVAICGTNLANFAFDPNGLYWLEDMQHVYKESLLVF
jgi:hypothetical protein